MPPPRSAPRFRETKWAHGSLAQPGQASFHS